MGNNSFMEIIDLTHEMKNGMASLLVPWHPPFVLESVGHIDTVGRNVKKITFGSHTGTHMDAPAHFVKGGSDIASIPLEKLMGPVSIIDVTHLGPRGAVTLEMVQKIKISERMIFHFGWAKHYNTEQFYKEWPHVALDAAEYLVKHGMFMIAMDTPSPDDPGVPFTSPQNSPVHKYLLHQQVIIVEYLANLAAVRDAEGWNISVMPLKLKHSDGSPVRACLFR